MTSDVLKARSEVSRNENLNQTANMKSYYLLCRILIINSFRYKQHK